MVWRVLKQACEEIDPSTTEALLKASGLTMPNGLLQQTYDERGYRYDLPPFVINLAVKYGTGLVKPQNVQFNPEDIKVVFRSTKFNDYTLVVSNQETVKNLKERLGKLLKIEKKIRLFYAGKELQENSLFGKYAIKNDFIIQVFVCET